MIAKFYEVLSLHSPLVLIEGNILHSVQSVLNGPETAFDFGYHLRIALQARVVVSYPGFRFPVRSCVMKGAQPKARFLPNGLILECR